MNKGFISSIESSILLVQNWQSWLSLEHVDQVHEFLRGEPLPPEGEGVAEEEKVLLVHPVQVLHILHEVGKEDIHSDHQNRKKNHFSWLESWANVTNVIIGQKLEFGLSEVSLLVELLKVQSCQFLFRHALGLVHVPPLLGLWQCVVERRNRLMNQRQLWAINHHQLINLH